MVKTCIKWAPILTVLALLVIFVLPVTVLAQNDHEYDPENGEEINELCAGCHGEYGQGGSDGQYPRLAGLPAKYLAKQLLAFRTHKRKSMAMAMYATERELPGNDYLDISIYHSKIELMTKMPYVDPDMRALDKLYIAKRVYNVARMEGDVEKGRDIFLKSCAKCHGKDALGKGSTPQLAGQYTEYLRVQILAYQNGERKNKRMDKYIMPLSSEDIEALLAFLSVVDDG